MKKAELEGKKTGIGLGFIVVAIIAALALTGRAKAGDEDLVPAGEGELPPAPPTTYPTQAPDGDPRFPLGSPENPLYAEIPGELISWDDWYEIRDIEAVLGWTREEYIRQMALIREIPSHLRTAEQQYAGGFADTWAAAEYYIERQKLIASTGGSWLNGVLQVPPGYPGSVTEYSNELAAMLLSGDSVIAGAVAAPVSAPVSYPTISPVPYTPASSPYLPPAPDIPLPSGQILTGIEAQIYLAMGGVY